MAIDDILHNVHQLDNIIFSYLIRFLIELMNPKKLFDKSSIHMWIHSNLSAYPEKILLKLIDARIPQQFATNIKILPTIFFKLT